MKTLQKLHKIYMISQCKHLMGGHPILFLIPHLKSKWAGSLFAAEDAGASIGNMKAQLEAHYWNAQEPRHHHLSPHQSYSVLEPLFFPCFGRWSTRGQQAIFEKSPVAHT